MQIRTIALALLIIGLLVTGGCPKKQAAREEKPPLPDDYLNIRAEAGSKEFGAVLDTIDAGKNILVEKKWLNLVPEKLNAHSFFDQFSSSWPWEIPDKRLNPAEADYILAQKSYYLGAVLAGAGDVWRVKASLARKNDTPLILLERAVSIEKQLARPLSEDAYSQQIRQMVEIKWGNTRREEGRNTADRFAIDIFEVSHAEYAYFLNDIGIAYDEANVFYSVKDPSSKIVYHQNRYQVYRGAKRLPVFNVSWYGALAFCEHIGKRLPDMDEWQKAAGVEKEYLYPWGGAQDFEHRANFEGDQDGYLYWAPVDAFPRGRSPYGLYNMSGNMYEWIGLNAVVGGSWEHRAEIAQITRSDTNFALARNLHDGFRCCANKIPE